MVKKVLIAAFLSMVPVAELRAALPVALASGLPAAFSYILCVFCNMIPVPFIILFIRRILTWMDGRGGKLRDISHWVENHAQKKLEAYHKYEVFGLYVFVAIPLPGTGAWTGALIAAFLGLRLKYAVPAIFAGVATAGLIMMAVSLGVIHILR